MAEQSGLVPSRRGVHAPGGLAGDAEARGDRRHRERGGRAPSRDADDDQVPSTPVADPALRRGLARPSDSRDGPLHLLASGLPRRPISRSDGRVHVGSGRPLVLGERPGRRGNTRGGAVDPEGAARGRRSARLWLDRPPHVRDLAPGASPIAAPAGRPAREHHPEHDDRLRDRCQRISSGGNPPVREPDRRRPETAIRS